MNLGSFICSKMMVNIKKYIINPYLHGVKYKICLIMQVMYSMNKLFSLDEKKNEERRPYIKE